MKIKLTYMTDMSETPYGVSVECSDGMCTLCTNEWSSISFEDAKQKLFKRLGKRPKIVVPDPEELEI